MKTVKLFPGTKFETELSGTVNHYINPDKGYVTDGKNWLVQLPDDNQWGFVLADDDQTWDGGFGSGMTDWELVPASRVPQSVKDDLGYLLEN